MKKKILAAVLSSAMILAMVGCGNTATPAATTAPAATTETKTEAPAATTETKTETPVEVRDVKLTIWSPSEDQDPEKGEWMVTLCNQFNEAHPEWNITFEFGVHSESEVKKELPKDLEAGADVFIYGSSGLENLVNGNAIAEIGGKYAEDIKANYSATLTRAITFEDGGIYGFPMTTDSYFMFYDKRVFSDEDVKNLDTMLSKGKVAIALTNGFYNGSFFCAGGANFFMKDGSFDRATGIVINGDGVLAVTNYMIDLFANPNFINAEPSDAISMMEQGQCDAYFCGTWQAAQTQELLGENYGVAKLPTITVDGKELQLQPFVSAKAIGVKSTCADPDVAMALAAYLSSEEAQKLHYTARGYVPSLNSLLSDPEISKDATVVVDADSAATIGYARPFFSEFGYYWTPAATYGENIRDGVITKDNAKEKLDELQVAVNTPAQ